MALLLSLETSTQGCSVALHNDGVLVVDKVIETPRSAASQLAVMIDEVFQSSNRKPQELKGVIVAAGPGSYTGLRIGVATAKGLCFALNIPIVSINTLELMAYQFLSTKSFESLNIKEALLCPMIDARRMEVYCAMLDQNLSYVEQVQAKVIDVAKERIFDYNKSVGQIAYELGFKYPQHFTRLFKQRVGQSPSEYRMGN